MVNKQRLSGEGKGAGKKGRVGGGKKERVRGRVKKTGKEVE